MDHKTTNKKMNQYIKELFHEEDWHLRAEAALQLGHLKDARATNLLCRALQKEEDPSVVNRIIEALGKIGDPRATIRIIERLEKEIKKEPLDKFKITYMIESLMELQDKRALTPISRFLNSEDQDLKDLAEKAFDKILPNWREIIEKERNKSVSDIFHLKM
ncbi:MAG: hypothetical protein GF383_01320 [Candidatus Lokiarchaeota archaeon]|nr:hypothetical protein [Candidatus Lokiarchaeota archaeon]MBD3337906.1 hypothetical protein [Candidatus Lokiarchaeota archaeon]